MFLIRRYFHYKRFVSSGIGKWHAIVGLSLVGLFSTRRFQYTISSDTRYSIDIIRVSNSNLQQHYYSDTGTRQSINLIVSDSIIALSKYVDYAKDFHKYWMKRSLARIVRMAYTSFVCTPPLPEDPHPKEISEQNEDGLNTLKTQKPERT